MIGPRNFRVSTKGIIFDIQLRRNVTVIRGEGATYKTLLYKMIQAAAIKGSGVHLESYHTRVLALADQEFAADHLRQYKGTDTILVFDEFAECVKTNAFREAIEETGCYFILITRNSCAGFGFSTKELCALTYDDTLDLTKRTVFLEHMYPEDTFGVYNQQSHVITEDSAAGKQFFNEVYGAKRVITAHGKTNIRKVIQANPNSIVVVDGAAFGFDVEDVIPLLSSFNCYLIAKESFEYVLLKSGVVDHLLPDDCNLSNPLVDSMRYLTWEQFYTDLLGTITKETPLQYSKAHLNSRYTLLENRSKILRAYGLAEGAIETRFFE